MPGNFDNIIREVLNSTQAKPVGDVVPFPELPKITQDGAPFAPDAKMKNSLYPPRGSGFNGMMYPYYVTPYGPPANEASIASAILRS